MRKRTTKRSVLRAVGVLAVAVLFLFGTAAEVAARGGRGGGGGGRGGGFSRGGMARGGGFGGRSTPSRRQDTYDYRPQRDRAADRERTYDRGRVEDRGGWGSGGGWNDSSTWDGNPRPSEGWGTGDGSRSRDGSFENRRGNTVDWETDVERTEDGFERDTSWTSSSGASGGNTSSVKVDDGRVQSVDRTRHAESASGETLDRTTSSERHGDTIEREGSIKTSTGIDADTASVIKKTDDGFIASGAIDGKHGDAAGTIIKDGDDVWARGVRTDGDDASFGRVHCNDGRCTGGRVTVDVDDYYDYPYYYYPYYYGWYSCPSGSVDVWTSSYGSPVYGCSNTYVVSTTIALAPSTASYAANTASSSTTSSSSGSNSSSSAGGAATATGRQADDDEARVTSTSVLMYEVAQPITVYSSDTRPAGVYSVQKGKRYFWALGPRHKAHDVDDWTSRAAAMAKPTANATVITYTIGDRTVYLTNEQPAPGYFSEPCDQLFAWIPGVRNPSAADRDAIARATAAHRAGGRQALDREARKLERSHAPPPESAQPPAS